MNNYHTTQNTPVTLFTDELSNDIEQITDNLHTKSLPPQGMSRATQLLPFLPFGSTTLWAWSRDGRFPAPVKLSPTMTAWHNADVIAWLNNPTSVINREV